MRKHAEKERHRDQPERPAPAPEHPDPQQGDERRHPYEEEESRAGRGELHGPIVDLERHREARRQGGSYQDEEAEHERLRPVGRHVVLPSRFESEEWQL